WVPQFLLMIDGGFAFHARFNGEPLTQMELKPSEYLMRQVRVAAFGYERPDILIRKAGDLFMFCSDFPHAEGMANPVVDYDAACAGRYHVVAPDLPSHGDSDPVDETEPRASRSEAEARPGVGRHALAATLPPLCEHFGMAPAVVVGASLGGITAITLGAARPD